MDIIFNRNLANFGTLSAYKYKIWAPLGAGVFLQLKWLQVLDDSAHHKNSANQYDSANHEDAAKGRFQKLSGLCFKTFPNFSVTTRECVF